MSSQKTKENVEDSLGDLKGTGIAGEPKEITLAFKGLSISAPDTGALLVKTLPRAILNTFGYDQVMWFRQKVLKPLSLDRSPKQKQILTDFTGLVKPGEMLLVLGRPGSGCSTFLRATANRSELHLAGDLQFAGVPHTQFYREHRREVIYLPEEDKHIPSLTVRQTLEFAVRMSLQKDQRSSKSVGETATALATMFGLDHALDSVVGGGAIPGVSGGERKRVSIAEVLAAGSTVQCFDNSTRGLDSSTALDFVKALRTLTDVSQKTTLATLYQAGENIYQHFDKVILLDAGRELYFGPTGDARQYFEELGFIFEPGQTTAEFLAMVTDPERRRAREGSFAATVKTADDLAMAFKQSKTFTALESDLAQTNHTASSQEKLPPSSTINLSYPLQIFQCLRREAQLLNGKRKVQYQKWINTVVLSLIIGSEYFNISTDASGAFTREGVIFYAIIANAWMQYPELFDAHGNRAVLERQSSLNMYRSSAVAIARVIIDIPLIAFQHALFMVSYYFLAHHNVAYTAGDFFFFYLVLCLSTLNFANLLRMFAYYVPSVEDCFRFGGIASTITVYFAGFLIPINQMAPVWSWLHYVSPSRYTYEALLTNEFRNIAIDCASDLIPQVKGASTANQICPVRGALPGQISVPGLEYAESFGFEYANRWRNVGLLIAFLAVYATIGIVGSEIMHFTAQGGEPLIFARKTKDSTKERNTTTDVEKSAPAHSADLAQESVGQISSRSPSLWWKDLTVTAGKKEILHNLFGFVNPGDLVALCGASGAGKTTLLTHLSQTNIVGESAGGLGFGDRPLGKYFKKIAGFAQQVDLHDGSTTIREALQFSALLRQPAIYSHEEKLAHVDRVLEVLDLTNLQNAIIGDADSGLGVELTKRVTIGVELAARPKILFADEPTSGLDSQGAATIIGYLRRLSQDGQAVVVTVHQPSASLFRLFNKLFALSSNGEQIYFGRIEDVLPYFARNGADAPADVNPAEFVLETIGAGIQGKSGDVADKWAKLWKESPEAQEVINTVNRIENEHVEWDEIDIESAFNTSNFHQTTLLTKRMLLNQWRKPSYVYSKIWVHIIQAILIGFTFYQLGTSPTDLQSRAFGAFALIFLVNTIVNPILLRFFGNRRLWQVREGPSRLYDWSALCTASILAEIPAILFTSVSYFLLWYFLTGLPLGEAAGYTFVMVITYELFETTFGFLITAMSPDLKMAGILLVFLVTTCNWFNGVVVPYDQIQIFWRYWVYYLNPLTYLFGGLITAVNSNLQVICNPNDLFTFPPPAGQTCDSYAGAWMQTAQANITNPTSTIECQVCQYTNGNQYLAKFNLDNGQLADNIWAYWAVFLLFTVSNVVLFYFFTWAKEIKKWKVLYFF